MNVEYETTLALSPVTISTISIKQLYSIKMKMLYSAGIRHINLVTCSLLVIHHIFAMLSIPQVASQCTFNNNEDNGKPFGIPYRMNLRTDDKWPITAVWAIIVDRK